MHDILKYDGDEREGCCSAGKGSAAGYGIYIHPLVMLVVQGKLHQRWPGCPSFHAVVCVVVVDVGFFMKN